MEARSSDVAVVAENNSARNAKILQYAVLGAAAVLMVTGSAVAGSDTTFQEADNFVSDFLSGTGGKTIGGVALLSAVINTVVRFNWMFFGSAVAIGLACGIGPNIMDSFFTGTF